MKRLQSRNIWLFVLLAVFVAFCAGGCGGSSSSYVEPGPGPGPGPGPNPEPEPEPGPGPGPNPEPEPEPSVNPTEVAEVKAEGFKLADWDMQEWQMAGNPDGEIHPLLPLMFEIKLRASRPGASVEDKLWIAFSLIDEAKESALPSGGFTSREAEPVSDPRYLGFYQIELTGGEQTEYAEIHPELSVVPGTYAGIRAEFFIPGEMGEMVGTAVFDWNERVTVLDKNAQPPLDEHWVEITFNADPPMESSSDYAEGFDFSAGAIVDPASGFQRLFVGDTPMYRSNVSDIVAGYYADLAVEVEIMAETGTVGSIEITEVNGLKIWDPENEVFVDSYIWKENHIADYDGGASLDRLPGFPRGSNGTALTVGATGATKPSVTLADVRFSFKAYDLNGQPMLGGIGSVGDETIRMQSRKARGAGDDYPMILPENPYRMDLPVSSHLRRIDFANNSFKWEESETNSTAWAKVMGPFVDYKGSGQRNIYGNEQGNKSKFAARAYAMFEEYAGIVHSLPPDGIYSVHDLATIAGTRTAVEVAVWLVDNKFTLLFAGAEFRNEIQAKTATEQTADGQYKLASDRSGLANFSKMEAEFNAELVILDVTLLSYPLYVNNQKPFDSKLKETELFRYSVEPAVSATFYILEVRAGVQCDFYVKLRLSNQFHNVTDGVNGTGSIALIPGIDAKGFVEGGVNIVIASVYLGFSLRFIDLAVVPTFEMNGTLAWKNGTGNALPVATADWNSVPKLGIEIKTLDGEIYVKYKVLFISGKEVFFKWKGLQFNLEVWKGTPKSRPSLALNLRRRS